MKLKNIILSLFFTASFLAQFFVQLHHAFGDHNHRVCHSIEVKHIHKKDLDCSIHYFKQDLTHHTLQEYQFVEINDINSVDILKKNFLKNHQQLSFSLRGPPAIGLS